MAAVAASGPGGGSLVHGWGALCCVHHGGTAMAGEERALQAQLGLRSFGFATLDSRGPHMEE